MIPFWAAILAGILAFAGYIPTILKAKPGGRYLRRPLRVTGMGRRDQSVAWEARMALKRHWFYPSVRPFLGSLLSLVVGVVFLISAQDAASPWESLKTFGGLVLGWGLAFAATYPWWLRKSVERYCLQSAEEAARSLARLTVKSKAMPLLDEAAAASLPRLRKAAIAGYLEIGSPECLDRLEQLTRDGDSTVALVAKFAHQELDNLIHHGTVLSVEPMARLVERVQYCRAQLDRRSNFVKRVDYDQKLEEAKKRIEEITRSQLHLRGAFPAVYCMDCLAGAERVEGEEWEWVRCHRCKEATALKYGVNQVIGEIGGPPEWRLDAGTLRVSLWDEAKRQARPGEVACIEVIGGQSIQYDWAVNAVIEKMRNYVSGNAGRTAVVLRDAPPLSSNTMSLVREFDPEVVSV